MIGLLPTNVRFNPRSPKLHVIPTLAFTAEDEVVAVVGSGPEDGGPGTFQLLRFDRDGRRISEVTLPLLTERNFPPYYVSTVAVSPSGVVHVSASNNEVFAFDAGGGVLAHHPSFAATLTWAQDGRLVAGIRCGRWSTYGVDDIVIVSKKPVVVVPETSPPAMEVVTVLSDDARNGQDSSSTRQIFEKLGIGKRVSAADPPDVYATSILPLASGRIAVGLQGLLRSGTTSFRYAILDHAGRERSTFGNSKKLKQSRLVYDRIHETLLLQNARALTVLGQDGKKKRAVRLSAAAARVLAGATLERASNRGRLLFLNRNTRSFLAFDHDGYDAKKGFDRRLDEALVEWAGRIRAAKNRHHIWKLGDRLGAAPEARTPTRARKSAR